MQIEERVVVKILTELLQPKIRVDGGDVEFERVDGDTIHLGAYADCATCSATSDCLRWWCEQEFSKALGYRCNVVIHKHPPYFTR